MEQQWVTYRQAAEQLGCSVESVRVRAIRNRWPRQMGNDRKARIQIPEGVTSVQRTPDATPDDSVVKALQAHVDTLREQLAAAEARAGEESAKAARAIQAFADLADRLDALAEARRPWWRRLAG
jgi:hypothetical protein